MNGGNFRPAQRGSQDLRVRGAIDGNGIHAFFCLPIAEMGELFNDPVS